MPLQPAYTWSETDSSINITIDNVPIKDQGQLFCSDRVVKLNVPPYLLLLDLKHAVDDDRSRATITRGRKVVISLVKAETGSWHKLTADGDAQSIKKQREDSVQRAHQKVLAAQQQRQARKQKEEREAIDLQIQQQKAQRDQLEALKQQELQEERQELQDWQEQLQQGDESDYEDDTIDGVHADAQTISSQDVAADGAPDSSTEEAYHGKGWWPSKAAEGVETSANSSDSRSTEVDPAAEPECISLTSSSNSSWNNPTLPQLITAPAASDQAAAACKDLLLDGPAADTAAADTPLISASSTRRLTPAGAGTASSHTQAATHGSSSSSSSSAPTKPVAPVRSRAAPVQVSFTQLQTPHLPAREQREVEIKQIKRAAGKDDSMDVADRQPAFLKDKGDGFAAQGNYRGAINAYTKALELDPNQAALWANRAAAHMALGQAEECVQDCTTAMRLVEQTAAALQAAPGAATEREMQAGMLGAAAGDAGGLPLAAAGGAAAANQQEDGLEPLAAAGQIQAVDISPMSPRSDGVGTSSAHGSQQTDAATAADCETGAAPAGSASSNSVQPGHQAGAATAGGASAADAGGTTSSSGSSPSSSQEAGLLQQDSSMAAKLKQLLVKLFARRAAAHVELQQLQEAADDLQAALRLDPHNQGLKADAMEVSLALNPDSSSDPAALKELGAARFKAGDLQGAAEAFTALIELIELLLSQQQAADELEVEQQAHGSDEQEQACAEAQQQQQMQMLLAGALSNRAACWLGLNKHEECVADCWAALQALAAGNRSVVAAVSSDAQLGGGAPTAGAYCSTERILSLGSGRSSSCSGVVLGLQHLQQPAQLLALTSKAAAQSAARTVARLAAACVCLKWLPAAEAAFDWAAACWGVLGEEGRVAAILADKHKLQQQV